MYAIGFKGAIVTSMSSKCFNGLESKFRKQDYEGHGGPLYRIPLNTAPDAWKSNYNGDFLVLTGPDVSSFDKAVEPKMPKWPGPDCSIDVNNDYVKKRRVKNSQFAIAITKVIAPPIHRADTDEEIKAFINDEERLTEKVLKEDVLNRALTVQ